MKTVLITGATGDVGTHLARELAGKYKLRLSDKRPLKAKNFIKADVSKMADALKITKGVDAIVHLGGYSVEGHWPAILQANIIGCYNVFEAARRNGVKRIIFRPATTRSASIGATRPSITESIRGPTAATACRRCSARRSGACTSTSTAWRCS